MTEMPKSKWTILITTTAAGLFAVWNVFDEQYLFVQDPVNRLGIVAFWLAAPIFNALAGLRSSDSATIHLSLSLATVFAAAFLFYALNGSTQYRGQGAQHMHLIVVPTLLIILTTALYGYLYDRRLAAGDRTEANID